MSYTRSAAKNITIEQLQFFTGWVDSAVSNCGRVEYYTGFAGSEGFFLIDGRYVWRKHYTVNGKATEEMVDDATWDIACALSRAVSAAVERQHSAIKDAEIARIRDHQEAIMAGILKGAIVDNDAAF